MKIAGVEGAYAVPILTYSGKVMGMKDRMKYGRKVTNQRPNVTTSPTRGDEKNTLHFSRKG